MTDWPGGAASTLIGLFEVVSVCCLFVCLFWTKGDINATSCRPKLITTTFFRGLVSLIKSGVRVGNCINYQRPSIYYSLRSILNRLQAVDLWTVDIDRTIYMMNVAGSLPTAAHSYTVLRQKQKNTTITIVTFKSNVVMNIFMIQESNVCPQETKIHK